MENTNLLLIVVGWIIMLIAIWARHNALRHIPDCYPHARRQSAWMHNALFLLFVVGILVVLLGTR